ncbi:uncharacterized protein LOC109283961 [Alligator mississippiensis]|uniref:uncharacterized protein LOC109283961 n=1 Tax=Alligator mississippiensis TaxID=8496 RepID=UPI0009072314|nr:uncharacterized protein LOC109283961 [Alligator mississippiensis]
MTDEITNIMTWHVTEVTDITYPAKIQYEERKIAEGNMRDEEAKATKFVFTDTVRTASRSPGCAQGGSRGEPAPLFPQQSPGLSPPRSRSLPLGREFGEENLPEAEPAAVPPHQANKISSLSRESMCMGDLFEHPMQNINAEKFPQSQTYCKYESPRKNGKLQNRLIREDISSNFTQVCSKTGMFRKSFSLSNVQGRVLRNKYKGKCQGSSKSLNLYNSHQGASGSCILHCSKKNTLRRMQSYKSWKRCWGRVGDDLDTSPGEVSSSKRQPPRNLYHWHSSSLCSGSLCLGSSSSLHHHCRSPCTRS